MTVAVNTLIDNVEVILKDAANIRWDAVDLIIWLNQGQKEIVIHKPDASVITESVVLTAGSKQALPTGGVMLIDVTRNMGTSAGAEADAGATISLVEKKVMDRLLPTWSSATGSTTTKHYMFDARNPTVYYVYPKSLGTNYVEISYSKVPTDSAAGGNITILDIYEGALMDYILYRAYSVNDDVNSVERAKHHLSAFMLSVGKLEQVETINNPI